MALPATDTFTGTDYASIDARTGWSAGHLDMIIRSNAACGEHGGNYATGASGLAANFWTGDAFGASHYSQAVITAAQGYSGQGVCVRHHATDDSFYGVLFNTGGCILFRRVTGSNTTLSSDETSRSAGSVLRLEVDGSSLTAIYNGTTILTATDSTLSGGSAGIFAYGDLGTSQLLDNWEGGNIGEAPASAKAYNYYAQL